MKNLFILFIAFILINLPPIFAQEESESSFIDELKLPEGLGISNQLEYSYDIHLKKEILENWLNMDYRSGIFSTGIRLDIFQPNDPDPSVNRGKIRYADISYKYISAEIGNKKEGLKVTLGNYYSFFGRGLILKSYEDRNIRIDNNLLGVKVEAGYDNFYLTALSGMPEGLESKRNDFLHAVDLEYRGVKNLKLGGTFASNTTEDENAARTQLASLRAAASIWNFDFYGEYGLKQNNDIKQNIFNGNENFAGKAIYANLNFYIGSFSISTEYKLYDNFALTSGDGTVIYNTPPALRKDHTFMLLNRHPSPLDQTNEQGFQFDVNYTFSAETYINANYSLTKTLNESSYFQRILGTKLPVRTQLNEIYLYGHHQWSDNFKTIAAVAYNEELSSDTKNVTPILENRFYFDDINSIRFVVEHQSTKNNTTDEKYYTDAFTLEYLRSPDFSAALVSEMQTKEPIEGKLIRKLWTFVQFGYRLGEHTDISLLLGSRQAGNICIGGICRYEPEFRGVELKMITRLY
ncbi:MAG: DUF6029 family protein [bacterium]